MLLKRISFPCRYSDMIHHFARPVPVLSMVTNQVVDYIYQAQGHKIMQWNNQKDQHSHQCHKEGGGGGAVPPPPREKVLPNIIPLT